MPHSIVKRLRTPIFSGVILILFAASSLLLSLSFAYRAHVAQNILRAQQQFTTIAIADNGAFLHGTFGEGFFHTNHESRLVKYSNRYLALYRLVSRSRNAVLDTRVFLRGASSLIWPVLSSQIDPEHLQSDDPYDWNHTYTGTCTSVSFLTDAEASELYGAYSARNSLFYKVEFAVEEEIVVHPFYSGKTTVTALSDCYTSAGEIPFTVGQKYIWIGQYMNPFIMENSACLEQKEQGINPTVPRRIFHPESTPWLLLGTMLPMVPNPDVPVRLGDIYPSPIYKEQLYQGKICSIACYPDDWHLYYRHPLNGTLEDFWADNPLWAEWRDKIAEKNARSLYVLTTDRLGSLPFFNQKKAWLADGRDFTAEELAGDRPACIISETLAQYNQLSVGDTIPLALYKTYFQKHGADMLLDNNFWNDTLLKAETPVTIVGFFSAPIKRFGEDPYSLSVNTILMPAQSVPVSPPAKSLPPSVSMLKSSDKEGLSSFFTDWGWDWRSFITHGSHLYPDLFTAIIKPGKLEAFKAEAAAAGLAEDLLYSDQGFSALEGPIKRLSETADTLFTLSLAVWGVLLIVLLILALRERHELGLLLSVGVRRKNATLRLVFGWLAVLLPALLIGGILASVSFGAFNEAVLGRLLTESEFNTRFSVGMTANSAATSAAELFAAQTAGQTPLAEIWLAALLQLFAYFFILWVLFALLARKKPQTLLRKKE